MKILFDTNVLISSVIARGACFEVFEYCVKNHQIATSKYIIDEFNEKLKEKFRCTNDEIKEASGIIFEKLIIYEPAYYENEYIKDKDDLEIIGTAVSAGCKCVITGDKELLGIKKTRNIDIISPSDFWKYERLCNL